MRISTRTAANRISESPLAKIDNPPDFKTPEPYLATPGHLLRRCHQISVAIFLDECQAFDLTPLQYVALSALATLGPMDKATIGGVVALDRTTVAVVTSKSGDWRRPVRLNTTGAPSWS